MPAATHKSLASPGPLLLVFATLLAVGWLLPFHAPPWVAVQSDAWLALASAAAALWLLLRSRGPWVLPWEAGALLVLALLPVGQFAAGQMYFAGSMWMNLGYLGALAFAVWMGARWQTHAPEQMLDGLFLAIGLAAFATVFVQLHQWLALLDGSEWWAMNSGASRPAGNFGQCNQAATLLCWGLCAVGWGAARGQVRWPVGVCAAALLLTGVALTGSRAALVGLVLAVGFVVVFRRLWTGRRWPWLLAGLALYYLVCVVWIAQLAAASSGDDILRAGSAQQRVKAIALFVDAALQRPWWGYGWNQSFLAQLAVADGHPGLDVRFSSSHNLFLDLLVWCGLPLGMLLIAGLAWWCWRLVARVATPRQFVAALMLMFALNHSMFEFPLHYAYFLLPFGWVAGALGTSLAGNAPQGFAVNSKLASALFLALVLLLGGILKDFAAMEQFRLNRWDKDANGPAAKEQVPHLTLLTDQEAILHLSTLRELEKDRTSEQLQQLQRVVEVFPGAGNMVVLAATLAVNGHPDEARWWLLRVYKMASADKCEYLQRDWLERGEQYPEIAAIAWPSKKAPVAPR
jgi:O-antigen ligase